MKKWLIATCLGFILGAVIPPAAGTCQDMSREDIIKEITVLKERISRLEEQLIKEEIPTRPKPEEKRHYHSVKGLAERLQTVEDELKQRKMLGNWSEKIHLSGLVEAGASYEKLDYKDPGLRDRDSSDITLSKVELGVDVDLSRYVQGHILFLWEEDKTEPVDLDEGFLTISGADKVPLYLNLGKMYVPFGRFESHFISDPLTLELGETRESAVVGGFKKDWLELSAGAFNGDIGKTGSDDHIDSYVASASFTLPQDSVSGLGLSAGVSYLSNIADSNGLQEVGIGVSAPSLKKHVGGLSAFVSACLRERFFLDAEYLGAVDRFEPGELSFEPGRGLKPRAWNFELAYRVTEGLECALRYEGTRDCGDFLPERQYGVALIYSLFENTSLALEYLHGRFDNDDKRDLLSAQLSAGF